MTDPAPMPADRLDAALAALCAAALTPSEVECLRQARIRAARIVPVSPPFTWSCGCGWTHVAAPAGLRCAECGAVRPEVQP